jgi:RNA polymerase sigma factor (sigma-70 family)
VKAEFANVATCVRLKKLACRQVRNDADGEDLFHQAIAVVIDTRAAGWDPDEKSFFAYMGSIINGIAINARRSARARREVPHDSVDEWPPDSSPDPESALDRKREIESLREKGQRLYDHLDPRDEVAIRIFQAYSGGCESVEEVSDWTGCTGQAVIAGLKRLKYHANAIWEEGQAGEQRRMQQLRAHSGQKGGRR